MSIPTEKQVTEWLLNADQHTGELQKVFRGYKKQERIEKQVNFVRNKLDKQTGILVGTMKKLHKSSGGMVKTWTDVVSVWQTAKGVAGALVGGLDKVLSRGQEVSKLYQGNTLAIDEAAKATKGLLSNQQLLVASNKAVAFELGFTEDQFADLAKGAVVAAQKIGGDVPKAIDDLMTGMARQSRLILDNLGIQVRVSEAQDVYAAALGKTAKQLTDAEKKQAFMNATIADLKRIAGAGEIQVTDLGTAYAVLKTETGNAYDAMAMYLAKAAFGVGVLGDLTNAIKGLRKAMSDPTGDEQEAIDAREKKLIQRRKDLNEQYGSMGYLAAAGMSEDQRLNAIAKIDAQLAGIKIQREELGLTRSITAEAKAQAMAMNDKATAALKAAKAGGVAGGARGGRGKGKGGKVLQFGKSGGGPQAPAESPFQGTEVTDQDFNEIFGSASFIQGFEEQTEAINAAKDAMKEYGDTTQAVSGILSNTLLSALDGIVTALVNVMMTAIKGGKELENSVLRSLEAVLEGIMAESTVKAVFFAAEAIGYAVMEQWDKAGTASAAAAAYAAVAVLAGGGAALIGAAGSKSSGDSGDTTGSSSTAAPTFSTSTDKKQPINVNVYIGDPQDPSTVLLGRKEVQAMASAA